MKLEDRLKKLPSAPGVYFHKDAQGEIIYIGKAANLRNRVRQYFQASRPRDPKTDVLISEIKDVEWREVATEADALFLEAELVRRYQPRFNILLRDDKSQQFIRIDYKSDYPTVRLVRRPLDDGAEYFGPYVNGLAVKKALRYLRRAFPYAISRPNGQTRANLYYHLGLDPGLEEGKTSLANYRADLRKLMQYLRGERVALTRQIERDMKKAAQARDFESAATLRNRLFCLQELSRQILFSDKENAELERDHALIQLAQLLGLFEHNTQVAQRSGRASGSARQQARPLRKLRRVEGFDISHMQGSDTVASMVVFSGGVPEKAAYRKFKMRVLGNDDFANMAETIRRRLREENVKKWPLADLVLIDGGKGQLSAAIGARDQAGFAKLPFIGLAKRQEDIIISRASSWPELNLEHVQEQVQALGGWCHVEADFLTVSLPASSPVVKLLQRIRDESHRFAVSYHSTLKRGRMTTSLLEEIPGIGPSSRKKLIKIFGSMRAVATASSADIGQVIGPAKAKVVASWLAGHKS